MTKALLIVDIQNDYFLGGRMELSGTEYIHSSVTPLAEEMLIQKHFPNRFRETKLLDHLRSAGITDLVIAGMMTHMCIDPKTRAVADTGFAYTLAHDACATRSLSFGATMVPAENVQSSFLAALNGIYATVRPASELIAGT